MKKKKTILNTNISLFHFNHIHTKPKILFIAFGSININLWEIQIKLDFFFFFPLM